ncbi:unnamed protein product [Toxocara canis]|uniref:BHLH domain-containing protein n=1 Tax=Toxocara canis TaxID=6265 RepID=A0A183UEY9_TOXCA|nr:unnamed protein product [Toxocara canis]
MDYVNDVPMSDPFLCLDTDLDDVSEVIRNNWVRASEMSASDLGVWSEMNGAEPRHTADPLLTFRQPSHSPQQHRDPDTCKEIGSIVSLLQEGDQMFDGAHDYRHFINEPFYNELSVAQCKDVNLCDGDVRSAYATKEERWQSGGEFMTKTAHNTKQELLDLIATLTPAEVEHLRASRHTSSYVHRERHPMAVGVATKMPLTIDGVDLASPIRRGSEAGSVMLSPRTTSSAASADLTVDTNDSDADADFGFSIRRGPKTERRTAHNLIEKKYRCSINDRIQCLKTMLSGEDAKVERLRHMLKVNGIEDAAASVSMMPPTSVTSNSISSSQSSPDPSECSPASVHPKRSRTMVDKSRVTMLAFMFGLVIWNPVSFFIDSSYPRTESGPDAILHSSIPGRSLQQAADAVPFDTTEAESLWWHSSIVRPCFVWSVNVFIVFCFLTRVLVYGEPVADAKSSSWTLFLNTKSAADTYIKRGNYNEASRLLRECLRVLERPLPTAGFDELISVLWQVIRHLLNSVWIGRWFARRKRSPAKPVTVLHLIGVENMGDGLTGLNLALSAVNLAESAGCSPDGLSHAHRADIYLNAALRVRITLPSFIGVPLYLYFMRRAQRHARRAEEGALEVCMFILVPPLERLTSAFKMELLNNLLTELSNPVTSNSRRFVDVSHLLLTICTAVQRKTRVKLIILESSSLGEVALNSEGDELCTWWAHVFACALYWKHGDNACAHKHYALVRKCPRQLLNSNISLAVGHAFCSRKLCTDDRSNRHFTEVVWAHATRSFSFLQRIDTHEAYARISPAANSVHEMVRNVSLEWLLMSVLDVWHSHMNNSKPYWEQSPIAPLKQLYQQAFIQFRLAAHNNENANCKVC